MYKLIFFVPDSHVESVKTAIFNAEGGKIDNYSHCSWQVLGQGQFKPLQSSSPYSGSLDTLTQVDEWRVELVIADHLIQDVINAMKAAHPYEVPAYDVIKLVEL